MKHLIARFTIVLFSLVLSSTAQVNGSGTPGVIPVWIGSGTPTETLGNSKIVETGIGNVGIGTTTPGATLTVVGQTGRPALAATGGRGAAVPLGDFGTAGTGGGLSLVAGSGGPACSALGGPGGAILITGGTGATSTPASTRCAGLRGGPGNVILAANGGNVGIGETGPAHTLEIKVGGTTLADEWTVRSSLRFKTDIQPLLGALEKVEHLQGVSYNRKDDGRREIGVVAEEVDKVVPEVVSHDPETNEVEGVDYSRLAALLIEAVKTQQAEIQQLKSRVEELTTKPRD
jgi:hypothetical protein